MMRLSSFVTVTVFIAMLLSVISLPNSILIAWPEWTILVLIYWSISIPERCGLFFAAIIGLLQDSITASVLGKHVLAYTVVISIALYSYQKLRMYDLWQQAIAIFVLLSIEQLIEYWLNSIVINSKITIFFFLPALTGALIWPWMTLSLRGIGRGLGMYKKIIEH